MTFSKFKLSIPLSIRIWFIHLVFYYVALGLLYQTAACINLHWYLGSFDAVWDKVVLKGLMTPIACIIGFMDFPGCLFLQVILYSILINYLSPKQHFKSYIISVLTIISFLNLYWFWKDGSFNISFSTRSYDARVELNYFYFFVPSFSIAILVNWFLFKNEFRRRQN